MYVLGVDVGGTSIKLGLLSVEGTIVDKWEIPTRKENHAESVIPDIAASIQEKMNEKQLKRDRILGIGVGVPAPVVGGGFIKTTANLGWVDKDVKGELEALTGLTVMVGNDANMAALGEMWIGAGDGEENMVMVTLGTGVGGGAIVGGRALVGANGAAAEIGHLKVNYGETRRCGCGKCGCLEQYASATGIAYLAKTRLLEDEKPSMLRGKEKVSAKDVFDAVKAGDEVAIEIAETFGKYLGYGLSDVAAAFDPAVFVIGGGVSKAGEIIIPFIEKYYHDRCFFADEEVRFVIATLDNDAGIAGAAKLLIDSVK